MHQPSDSNSQERELFSLAFSHFPNVEKIRDLKTSQLGKLIAISGTITRST